MPVKHVKIAGGIEKKLSATLRAAPYRLRVGFMESDRYPRGIPIATVAAINDFGAPSRGIPPRPFFRNMVRDKSPQWPNTLADLLKANGYDAKAALDKMGLIIADQLRDSILHGAWTPNAPSTVKRKGSNQPLIDTRRMIDSVTHEVI